MANARQDRAVHSHGLDGTRRLRVYSLRAPLAQVACVWRPQYRARDDRCPVARYIQAVPPVTGHRRARTGQPSALPYTDRNGTRVWVMCPALRTEDPGARILVVRPRDGHTLCVGRHLNKRRRRGRAALSAKLEYLAP